jgi:hypothetical protein
LVVAKLLRNLSRALWPRLADLTEAFQVEFLEAAINLLPDYPPRSLPSKAILETASFRSLVEVLCEAPEIEWSRADDEKPKLVHWYDHFEGDDDYEWTDEYFSRVFRGLIGVVEEHGKAGWESARWLVYDAVSPEYPRALISVDKGFFLVL